MAFFAIDTYVDLSVVQCEVESEHCGGPIELDTKRVNVRDQPQRAEFESAKRSQTLRE